MATYYVDPAAGGSNNGTSWTNAWVTWADAIAGTNGTAPAAGDVVYMRGTETISATVQFAAAGDATSGHIKWIGCNASGVVDGTQYTVSTGTNAIDALDHNAKSYQWIENIRLTSTSGAGHGFKYNNVSQSSHWEVINVTVDSFTGYAVNNNNYITSSTFYRCSFKDCTSGGFYRPHSSLVFIGCEFSGNTGSGVISIGPSLYVGCIFKDNTADGFDGYAGANFVNCVFDNNNYGITESYTGRFNIIGCRFTNNTTKGVSLNATYPKMNVVRHSYLDDTLANAVTFDVNEVSTTTESGTDTNDGYVDPSADNFNLAADATGREVAIDIDGTNKHWISMGLDPQDTPGSGARHPLARF